MEYPNKSDPKQIFRSKRTLRRTHGKYCMLLCMQIPFNGKFDVQQITKVNAVDRVKIRNTIINLQNKLSLYLMLQKLELMSKNQFQFSMLRHFQSQKFLSLTI